MNRLYRFLINFLIIVPFPNSIFGLSSNVLTLAYISFLTVFMWLLMTTTTRPLKMRGGLIVVYLLIFSVLLMNITTLFAFTFYVRIFFALTAGSFFVALNSSSPEKELMSTLKAIMYVIGAASFLVYFVHPPEDGRLISLFDVHTSKYFFFAFVVIFTHQVLVHNRTSDYVALCFAFFLLSLSLQRGMLASAFFFLLLTFRESLFKKMTWIALVVIVSFQIGFFDPLINRLFYDSSTSISEVIFNIGSSGGFSSLITKINSSGRLEFWTYLWQNEKITLFGSGLGHSIEIGKTLFPGLNLVHNDFLWLLVDTGIFGIALLTLIFFYLYKQIARQEDRKLKRVYLSLLLSIPIVMSVDNVVIHIHAYFPLLFGYFGFCNKSTS